jgi:cellulose synthase/poly-beta-1,6-N-acetylglucosamine synthase-like glycosyltransferase
MISIVIISKDEPDLDGTLTDVASQASSLTEPCETVVVDASSRRLDYIRQRHASTVRWLDFQPPPGVRISIPHQRNAGVREARGDIIVFTDAGCRPQPGWLASLIAPLRQDERVVAGSTKDPSGEGRWEFAAESVKEGTYLREAGTINLAFRREVFDAVGGFDENFEYGSDMDFSWRLTDAGYRILSVPGAVVEHDWGTPQRNRRRCYAYGKARVRLYRKHRERAKRIVRNDPMCVVYPLFVLGLPVTLVFPLYPLLLLIPAWRYRSRGVAGAVRVQIDYVTYGAGVLSELAGR